MVRTSLHLDNNTPYPPTSAPLTPHRPRTRQQPQRTTDSPSPCPERRPQTAHVNGVANTHDRLSTRRATGGDALEHWSARQQIPHRQLQIPLRVGEPEWHASSISNDMH